MNEKTFRVLEYEKIINMLTERASSSSGRKMCAELKPSKNMYEIQESLNETREAFEIVLKWGNIPLHGAKDIEDAVKRSRKGAMLLPKDLLNVCDVLRCVRSIKSFMKEGSKSELYPIIYEIVDSLVVVKPLEEAIEKAILNEEEIADKASEKLFNIRKSIKEKNTRIREKLQSLLMSHSKYLQDALITIRGDRYVIPVKAEYRSNVPGLIHDQSASGSTFFIEPMPIVELNNELKELELKEKAEIERILMELTAKVEENADYLEHDNKNIAYLDFLMAKAKFGLDLDGNIPEINDRGIINLKSARHPLIDKDKVVPTDIRLGETYKALIITGPNTGGKTVTLKTAGLITLMAMSGLAIPAREGSMVSIFNNIFADIGDEQSIEQSLSTFSSHMTNIVEILKNTNSNSLVLVDELGAGTDPTEGAALAMSILKKLYTKGAKVIGTTHYSELKIFAMETEGFENACVEFNVETLRPTYRLLTGIPGKSNAFEISKRLGLMEDIIDNARTMISKDAAKFENVIENLQNKTTLAERELDEVEKIKREVASVKKELFDKKYKLDNQRDKIIKQAQEEARRTTRQAKEEADLIIKELNALRVKAVEASSIKEAEEKRNKLNEKLSNMKITDVNTLELKDGMVPASNLKVGDEVFVSTLSQKAIVLSLPDNKGEAVVQAGIMKINVPKDKLFIETKKKKQVQKTGVTSIVKEKTKNISSSIDLRGQNIDEGIYNIDKYLDDAYLAGMENVTIIHGKGTGVLREGIQDYLKKHHYVKKIRNGDIHEGGLGVTIAELKK